MLFRGGGGWGVGMGSVGVGGGVGVQRSKCPKFRKTRGENPQMCPFAELSSSFLVIPHAFIGTASIYR